MDSRLARVWLSCLWLTVLSIPQGAVAADEPAAAEAAAVDEKGEEGEEGEALGADDEIEALVGPTFTETLVVTASRSEESLLDAPVSITVIGPEQIETTAADNLGDLLRGVPGLNATQTSARQISITTRTPSSALATSQLALIDGRSIYQDFFGLVMWDVLPVSFDEVKQVEVLRGPGSAVWGANALSGVVNVRTKSPRELDGGLALVSVGEQGTRAASVRWADAFAHWSYKISGSWYEQAPWDRSNTYADGTPIPADYDFANEGTEQPKLDLRVDHEEGDRLWSVRAGHGGTTGLMHSGIGPFAIARGAFMSYYEVDHEQGALKARLYLNQLDGDAMNLLNGLPFSFQTNTWVAEVSHGRKVGKRHELAYGGNARLNLFDLSLAPGEDRRSEAGVYLEDRIQLKPHWKLRLGARLDWFDAVGTTLSPRTALLWQPTAGRTLRVAWSRAFRAPSLTNQYLNTAVPNLYTLPNGNDFVFATLAQGDEDLQEETADAFEIGWTEVVKSSMINVAVYRNVTRDVIDFYPAEYYSADDPPRGLAPEDVPERTLVKRYAYRNVGETVDEGLEVSCESGWGKGRFSTLSWTYQEPSKITKDDPLDPLNVNLAPRHQVAARFGWQRGRTQGSVGASWTARAFWSDVLDERFWGWTDSYLLLDASLGIKMAGARLELKLSGTNLLDQEVKQHVFGDIMRRRLAAELRWRF